ncbi:hypothetical protein H5410_056519 [Solanum commersonii]|uniref:Uncharacterized protein n=1 Tax=Solanum commersonii TaxID=4109 RepID=A0A9J5WKF8_SOLCO|nr:hypothetical protein H5410_056519 [Solanum commersonii]
MDYSTRKSTKQGVYPFRGSFDHENKPVYPSGQTDSIAKHTKTGKMGVYLLRGSFDLGNGLVCPSGPTRSISKVLMDIHKKFLQK